MRDAVARTHHGWREEREKSLRSRFELPKRQEVLVYSKADRSLKLVPAEVREGSGRLRQTRTVTDRYIQASLGGQNISAFPDNGAAANFMSLKYAEQHGLSINQASRAPVEFGDGSVEEILGTTSLPFTFAGEEKTYNITLNVLKRCIHDVVLGSLFLRATETWTRFTHRVKETTRKVFAYRVRLLDSREYVRGRINDLSVDAIPDTGADVCVMSSSFVEKHGFRVDTSAECQIPLEFANGNKANTSGMVRSIPWEFAGSTTAHITGFYVLPDLPTDMVLSYDFLRDTNAFVSHKDDFWTDPRTNGTDSSSLNVIRIGSWMEGFRSTFSCECTLAIASSRTTID